MIKNFCRLLIMVRDKPLLFFAITLPIVVILAVSAAAIFIVISEFALDKNTDNFNIERLVLLILFVPWAPFSFIIMFLFFESYIYTVFRITRLGWLFGIKERKLAKFVAAWAEKRLGVEK